MKHILTSVFVFLIFTFPAHATNAVGKIITIEGDATIQHPSEDTAIKLYSDMNVHMDDTIETMENARLVVLFNDNSEITLGEDAKLTIDQYVFDPLTAENNTATFDILDGAFLLKSGFITKTENPDVTIHTNHASIGIRGTIVWGGPVKDKYGVLLQDGLVEVVNSAGKTDLTPGLGTFVQTAQSKPTEAKSWSEETVDEAVSKVTLKNPDAVEALLAQRKFDNQRAIESARE